jgi:hypothetical protein
VRIDAAGLRASFSAQSRDALRELKPGDAIRVLDTTVTSGKAHSGLFQPMRSA